MEINYKTEDGYYLDYEDLRVFLIFKITELKKEGLQNNQIFDYFEDEEDHHIIHVIIKNIIKIKK
ncbi:hypothetical protein [uncultured Bacteroides sp.]|uniref:hypothetical protein n=1 Tax=uncultured Bacteroides sp. TaxID=162156 RepID=UPI002AA721FF|nr:hypothetical protein [uncultured Bacteroides sp.]